MFEALGYGVYVGSFPGVACCRLTELPADKAAPLQDQGLREPAAYAETNFVQVLPLLALETAVAMNAIPSTPSSTVG